jgi:4'-phosphopantetheinyl transferase
VLATVRPDNATIQWIDELPGWNRAVPATLIMADGAVEKRHAALKAFVARALSLSPDRVEIEHVRDRPPIIARPLGAGLYLSLASRGGLAAMAAAPAPVGVDLELVDENAEIPWNVLHPGEAAMLAALKDRPQAMAFTRLWSLKEAYLKSLGVGLKREPSSFLVRFADSEVATIIDPVQSAGVADARTTWRGSGGIWNAVSTVVLHRFKY